jgi:TolB-like protein/DNA-binding winged helix-turn-helix (wHTH) protein/Flp pilus assembly protein TadD
MHNRFRQEICASFAFDRGYNLSSDIQGLFAVPMENVAPAASRVSFGVFEMELQTGELRRAGVHIHLPPQPFRVLVLLTSRPGQLVTRQEIRQLIWGSDTFVDFEHGLNFAIRKIRDALGDDADAPRYIQTLPRRGYRFIAPVQMHPAQCTGAETQRTPTAEGCQHIFDAEKTNAGSGSARVRRFLSLGLGLVTAVLALLLVLNSADLREHSLSALHIGSPPTLPRIESIAVLPIESLSGDPEQEFFADGLTDTLITDLGQILTLRVISRASVLRYKRGKTPLPEIAQQLDVDAVVEGTVVRATDRIRVSVQLLDARSDHHLWAETYERKVEDVIVLEREVALAIAHEISGRLSTEQELRLTRWGPANLQAYNAYLRGRRLLAERTPEAETAGRGYFQEALRADPNYAPAYSGLANFYSVAWSVKSDYSLAEEYARKAIKLDPNLAEGHASLGIAELYRHRFEDAEKEFRQAISLNPSYALAHHFYADYWLYMGDSTEALAENTRARELDPFSYAINAMRGAILWYAGQRDEAVNQFQTLISLNAQSVVPHEALVHLYWSESKVPLALAEERKIAALTHDTRLARNADLVATVYAHSGPRAACLRDLQLRERARAQAAQSSQLGHGLYTASSIAMQYALLEDRKQTLNWLDIAALEDLGHLPEDLACASEFDFVRSDPRFQSIQRTLGLRVK